MIIPIYKVPVWPDAADPAVDGGHLVGAGAWDHQDRRQVPAPDISRDTERGKQVFGILSSLQLFR